MRIKLTYYTFLPDTHHGQKEPEVQHSRRPQGAVKDWRNKRMHMEAVELAVEQAEDVAVDVAVEQAVEQAVAVAVVHSGPHLRHLQHLQLNHRELQPYLSCHILFP